MTRNELIQEFLSICKRSQGPGQAADLLNFRGIPTPNGRDEWTANRAHAFRQRIAEATERRLKP